MQIQTPYFHIRFALLATLLVFSTVVKAESEQCQAKKIDLWTKASYATGGSDLIIQGKRVRLNSIYTPQREKQYKFKTVSEPLSKEAQAFLNKLMANQDMEVGVEYDEVKVDKNGRQLVHLFLKDGTNVQKAMLESGYALNRPNENGRYAECYFEAEQTARNNKVQLWDYLAQYPDNNFPLATSSKLTADDKGFRIISGKVEFVDQNSRHFIINMDTTGIRIPKSHWSLFNEKQLKALKGKTIEVRGMSYTYRGAMYVIIKHPHAINLFNPLHQKTR